MAWYQALLLGCLGGAVPDVLRIIAARYKEAPDYIRRPFFWIAWAMLIALGGLCSMLAEPISAVAALSVGYSAPEIVSRLLGSSPKSKSSRVRKKIEDEDVRELLERIERVAQEPPKGAKAGVEQLRKAIDVLQTAIPSTPHEAASHSIIDEIREWWAI
jgi:hypothetical protein